MSTALPCLTQQLTAMASSITLTVVDPHDGANAAMQAAMRVIGDVAATCTRFDPSSPLMRANAEPDAWHRVPAVLRDAVREAHTAYRDTDGRFDPRVLRELVRDGYGESRRFSEAPVLDEAAPAATDVQRPTWEPGFDGDRLHLGPEPIDLGGIGKGLAVRWAAEALRDAGRGFLVDAGGDIATGGISPEGNHWSIGIENPWNSAGEPVAVVDATDAAVATSSIRLRSWTHDGRVRHHLIDPRTGQPGGAGLVAVSVIAEDAATAEVWTKALFLEGAHGIDAAASARGLAAVWVTSDGRVFMSVDAMSRVTWSVPRAAH